MRPGYNLGVCKMTSTLLKLNLTFPTIVKLLPVGGGGVGVFGWQTEGFWPVHKKLG